jgi:hypothetical protein
VSPSSSETFDELTDHRMPDDLAERLPWAISVVLGG